MVKLICAGDVGVMLCFIINRPSQTVAHIIIRVADRPIAPLSTREPIKSIIGEALVIPGSIGALDIDEITVVVIGVDAFHLLPGIGYL
ncbi:hypothetical protein ES703_98899 [subsurface metagenome]